MKGARKTWLPFLNKLLSLLLVLLGFNSCDSEDDGGGMLLMYGMPPVKYSVKANVLDEANKPIEGIRVRVKSEAYGNHTMTEGLTNAKGVFEGHVYEELINVVCEDIDGDKNGTFEKDSLQADVSEMKGPHYEFVIKLKSKK